MRHVRRIIQRGIGRVRDGSGRLSFSARRRLGAHSIGFVLLSASLLAFSSACADSPAAFIGKVVVEWLDDPFVQKMRLAADFAFQDAEGKTWLARAGQVVDGRAFPPVAQMLAGPPLSGEYRKAFVVYESYARHMTEPWRAVDRMLYGASRTEGMDEIDAKVVYAAAYAAGSRWETKATSTCFGSCHAAAPSLTWRPAVNETDLRRWGDWVRANNPALNEIDAHLDAEIRRPGPHLFVQR